MLTSQLFKKFVIQLNSLIPINSYYIFKNEITLINSKQWFLFNLFFIKYHSLSQFKILSSITAVDYIERLNRYEIIYDLLSINYNTRIRFKLYSEDLNILFLSSNSIYSNSIWWEREIWDLFGIYFIQNPDLRRILTDYGFEGFPLRKDFPLTGFYELSYNYIKRSCLYESLELAQSNKNLNSLIAW